MTSKINPSTRRAILLSAAALTGLPLLAGPKQAKAAGMPQANVKYQNHPNGANSCAICTYFVPGASPTAAGSCKVVAGSIAPAAWCMLFAPKPR